MSSESADRLKELTIGKRLKTLEKELRGKKPSIFLDQIRIDVAAEEEIVGIISKAKIETKIKRQFVIKVTGGHEHG